MYCTDYERNIFQYILSPYPLISNYSEYSYSAVFGGETKPHCMKTALIEQSFM